MNFQEAISEIESPNFANTLNLASGEAAFFRAARRMLPVQSLVSLGQNNMAVQQAILERIDALVSQPTDTNYENPNDAALAVYLMVVYTLRPDIVLGVAGTVAQAPSCWYAHKLAQKILTASQVSSGSQMVRPALENLLKVDSMRVGDMRAEFFVHEALMAGPTITLRGGTNVIQLAGHIPSKVVLGSRSGSMHPVQLVLNK